MVKVPEFQKNLLNWFESNGRNFPWRRKTTTKYELIVSEALLQRTKAETVAKFFSKFMTRYPSWKMLAEASEAELQEFLKPLGLNIQRGTRLFKLAQELSRRNGIFPKNRQEVEELPMMGQYITNAYELYFLNRRSPLLDVNMARLLERYFGPRSKADIRHDEYLQGLARNVVDHPQAIKINWSILDFAALVCKARNPLCAQCMLRAGCLQINKLSP